MRRDETCSELTDSEASPSVRLGLIVPWCKDTEKSEKKCNCTCPVSQRYFCNIKRAPDYRHVNKGTWLDFSLMNVIYFSKRGLIMDPRPCLLPQGAQRN